MRTFTDEEREQIREQLIQTGRERLLTYGPKKTTVEDITEPVGIAKPTFYQFFDAKSEIYLVILEREIDEYIANVRTELEGVDDPREGLERFFWCYVEFVEENPLVQQMIIKGNYQDLIGGESMEQIDEMQQKAGAELIPILEDLKAQTDGPLAEMDPLFVAGLMSASLGWLMVHKDIYDEYETGLENIEEGYYKNVQRSLISILARGMTVPG